ncbi:MAG: acyltransferase, partial [Actinobacteria bacterium]|nr:acyltransferase [Actinomycetota bacterium]
YNHLVAENAWAQYLTWIVQVMPIFFLVGGYANAASWRSARRRGEPYGAWLRARLRRLLLPVLPLLLLWTVVALIALRMGAEAHLVGLASQVALVPLWFLATYVMVVAVTPMTLRAWERFGFVSLLVGALLAGMMDLLSLGLGVIGAGFLNYLFVWGTVHGLGYAWADSRLGGVTRRLVLSGVGLLTAVALVILGPYPVAMVGLATDGVNNSQPPKVTLIALALFQTGLLLAAEGPVRRWLSRDRNWAPVVMINGRIMTIYLWHMTSMVLVIVGLMLAGGVGLGLEIDSAAWWLTRPLWLGGLALVTWPFIRGLGRFERWGDDHRPSPPVWKPLLATMMTCAALGFLAAFGVADERGLNGLILSLPFVAVMVGGIGGMGPVKRADDRVSERSADA